MKPYLENLKNPLVLLFAGMSLALIGQGLAQHYLLISLLCYSLAVSLWLLGLWGRKTELRTLNSANPQSGDRIGWLLVLRLYLGFMGLALGILTYGLARDELHFRPMLLLYWIGSVLCMWAALGLSRPERLFTWAHGYAPLQREFFLDGFALTIIIAVGAAALFSRLDHLPDAMTSDHVEYVLDAYRVVDGQYDIYFGNNSGREPAFLYLIALFSGWGHPSFIHLKMISACAVLLTLPLLYILGRLAEDRWTGIMAAGLGAVSGWHLVMGRLGFRVALASLASAVLLICLWRALRSGKRGDFLLTGFILGVGLYGYSSFRIAPLVIVAGVALAALQGDWRARRRLALNSLMMVTLAFLVYLPLLAFWVRYPNLYWYRANTLAGNTVDIWDYWSGLGKTLWMFNFGSDPVDLNLPIVEAPVLGVVTGAGFILGLLAWCWHAYRSRDTLEFLPLAALLIFILPSALAVSKPLEMPSARRAIDALPVVMLLAGSGLALPLRALAGHKGKWSYVAIWLASALLLFHAYLDLNAYFGQYPEHYRARSERAVAYVIRQFLAKGGSLDDVYIIYGGGWLDPRAVGIWLQHPEWNHVIAAVDSTTCLPDAPQNEPLLVLMGYGDDANLLALRQCYPESIVTPYEFQYYGLFYGIETEAGEE